MKKLAILSLLFIFSSSILFAQKSINSYKYIIVPSQFEFQKGEDQYQVNSLTKFLFNKHGFEAYISTDDKPEELLLNNCSALVAKVVQESSMFTTKLKIQLVDCYNKKVFETELAKTKEKDFKKAFHECVRGAFEEIIGLNYKYEPTNKVQKVIQPVVEQKIEAPVKQVVKKVTPLNLSILGDYLIGNWGKSTISKKGDGYTVVSGDENFELASITKTSKPTIFFIKWVTFKQPQLLELTAEGDLNVDTKDGIVVYKKAN